MDQPVPTASTTQDEMTEDEGHNVEHDEERGQEVSMEGTPSKDPAPLEAFLYTPHSSVAAPRRSVASASIVSIDSANVIKVETLPAKKRLTISEEKKKSMLKDGQRILEEQGDDDDDDDNNGDTKAEGSKRKVVIIGLCFIIVVVGIVLGIVFGIQKDTEEPVAIPVPETNLPTMAPIIAATPVPTSMPTDPIPPTQSPTGAPTSIQFALIAEEVERQFPNLDYSSNGFSAASRQAIRWMAEEDLFFDTFPIPADDLVTQFEFRRRYALVVLYFATNGPQWTNQCNFLDPNMHICNWNVTLPDPANFPVELQYDVLGVTCIEGEVRVVEIASNNLQGTIPPEIIGLPNLAIFTIAANNLHGTIPWSYMPLKMQYLDVGFNQLTGTIPPIAELTRLQFLYVDANLLTGTLPGSIYQLRNLIARENVMTGTFPVPRPTLASPLVQLFLGLNQFTGTIPTSIGFLRNLTDFSILDNQFSGPFPFAEVSTQLGRLRSLTLSKNQLTGNIETSDVWQLRALQQLFLSENLFTGRIDPRMMSELQFLISLDVADNGPIIGTLPTEIGLLTRLQNFNVRNNQLTGTLPTQLGLLTQLRTLLLSNNTFVGKIPTQLDQLTNISTLFVQGNRVSGSLEGPCDILVSGGLGFRADCLDDVVCTCCSQCCQRQGLNCQAQ